MAVLSLPELAALVGGQFVSTPSVPLQLRGAAALAEAGPEHVTFYSNNARYLPALKSSQAGVVLTSYDFDEVVAPLVLKVENPSAAFTKVVRHFVAPPPVFAPGIHPSAVVAPDAELGEGVSIQPFVVVESGAKIGAGTVIGAHGYIGHGVQIGAHCHFHPRVTVAHSCRVGNRVQLHSGVVIGTDGFGYEFRDGRHEKVPQVGVVEIEDDVEVGANATIDRARFGRTWIQEGTKIDNLVQVAHNVVVGKHCILVAQVGISGSCKLGQYVTLAGQVGMAGHLEMADQVTVGAKSGVTRSFTTPGNYIGYPAVPAERWREEVAQVRRLGKLLDRVKRLEERLDGRT